MQQQYYMRFQKAVARSLNWQLYEEREVYFYTDFLQQQPNVFVKPLQEALHILERRLLEFFSTNMVATRRGLSVEECDYEELRLEARTISLPEVFQEMQKYPLTVTTMLYYLFQEKESLTPALITVGNVISRDQLGQQAAYHWSAAQLKKYQKLQADARTERLSVWLTFKDGTLLNPTLKLVHPQAGDVSLLYLSDSEDQHSAFIYDPILVGGARLMQQFGNC